MKRYNELAPEVLASLDEAAVAKLIDLEVAFAGIQPVPEPVKSEDEEPAFKLKPTVKAYKVGNLLFDNEEDANTVASLATREEGYEYAGGAGYNYKWLKDAHHSVEIVSYYTEAEVRAALPVITMKVKTKETRESDAAEYKAYTEKIAAIRNTVAEKLGEARRFKRELDLARKTWNRYLELAEGDANLAEKFYMEAYKNNEELARKATDFRAEILYQGNEPK